MRQKPKPNDIRSALVKVRRARKRISEFNQKVEAFLHSDAYKIVRNLDAKQLADVWHFRVYEDAPDELAVELGEIFHLLRSALDNVICGLVRAHGRSVDRISFPFSRLGREGVQACTAMKGERLPEEVQQMILELQPYPGGNDLLWLLHDANREDKHQSMQVVTAGLVIYVGRVRVIRGDILSIGDRSGQSLVTTITNGRRALVANSAKTRGTLRVIQGKNYIEFSAGQGGSQHEIEFMRTTMGAEIDADIYPALDIVFPEGILPGREKAARHLCTLSKTVETFIHEIVRRFFI